MKYNVFSNKNVLNCHVLKHGRLKVRTTAEQQEAKRKEREKKLKIYNAATDRAFEKVRQNFTPVPNCIWVQRLVSLMSLISSCS